MSDEKYSVVFDMIAKGGRPLILNAPPLGSSTGGVTIGFASGGNASQQKAQANAWAVVIGAAVIGGMLKGFDSVKASKVAIPTKRVVRTDVFQGADKLREALPYRNTTPAQISEIRKGSIKANMEATAYKERNRQLLNEKMEDKIKKENEINSYKLKEMSLQVDKQQLEQQVKQYQEKETRQHLNRVAGQRLRRENESRESHWQQVADYQAKTGFLENLKSRGIIAPAPRSMGEPLVPKETGRRGRIKGEEPGFGKTRNRQPDEEVDKNYKRLKNNSREMELQEAQ